VLGGTQSLHTNSLDEALALPSEEAVTIALRTQQVIAHESGVANVADPLGGSYYVEALTGKMEKGAFDLFRRIDDLGGMVAAIEAGFPQQEIAEASYRYQKAVERKEKIIVGVNQYVVPEEKPAQVLHIDEQVERDQRQRLSALRARRDGARVARSLTRLTEVARGDGNTMPHILEAVKSYATLGEIVDRLKTVFGGYQEPASY